MKEREKKNWVIEGHVPLLLQLQSIYRRVYGGLSCSFSFPHSVFFSSSSFCCLYISFRFLLFFFHPKRPLGSPGDSQGTSSVHHLFSSFLSFQIIWRDRTSCLLICLPFCFPSFSSSSSSSFFYDRTTQKSYYIWSILGRPTPRQAIYFKFCPSSSPVRLLAPIKTRRGKERSQRLG